MTTMTAIFPHHWVVEEKDWNQVEKNPTQLSLLDFPEKELPFNLKDSKNWSEQNPKFQEKVILESGRDHFIIDFRIDLSDQEFFNMINDYLYCLEARSTVLDSFDSRLVHTVNASEISTRLGITISDFELKMQKLATSSFSVEQYRKVIHSKTSKRELKFLKLFSTNLVSEYVSFAVGTEVFYSFNYTQYFEKYYQKGSLYCNIMSLPFGKAI
ncbi:hypothetical protein NCY62_18665 (plasmid) [Acinetobacter pittii]|uniref:AraC family transcriptional regulator n=1 Tax=Acinetobacter nosocomialis TaxID=106654 RepID=A0AB37D065_ACINO|nr:MULTISPECIES: hypothetical protein [Acinetobacter]AMM30639.1 hypothetical protein AYJ52_19470 [Acinetobacter pittii]MCJ9255150.1 hypothetical protein [Acinetobacter baumannii]MCJ9258682.1 hypothetical protein [Acinetobacter baumannii]MCM1963631.1 hypothetical protein [Acinetobacter pittii]MCM1980201.1 hypothetical protein [Acinetobacter pittii]